MAAVAVVAPAAVVVDFTVETSNNSLWCRVSAARPTKRIVVIRSSSGGLDDDPASLFLQQQTVLYQPTQLLWPTNSRLQKHDYGGAKNGRRARKSEHFSSRSPAKYWPFESRLSIAVDVVAKISTATSLRIPIPIRLQQETHSPP